ncbi:hypothetical protein STAQ_17380 [Allostella sp. ATCC 35155]|nr:hypothetical protein STAQ_17380 [Stella sp. ATCC 35155]
MTDRTLDLALLRQSLSATADLAAYRQPGEGDAPMRRTSPAKVGKKGAAPPRGAA